MFPFNGKADSSDVPVITLKMLIGIQIFVIAFIAFIHWRLMSLHDF